MVHQANQKLNWLELLRFDTLFGQEYATGATPGGRIIIAIPFMFAGCLFVRIDL